MKDSTTTSTAVPACTTPPSTLPITQQLAWSLRLPQHVRPDRPPRSTPTLPRSLLPPPRDIAICQSVRPGRFKHPPGSQLQQYPFLHPAIQPPAESPRRDVLLTDKDYLYLQMIEERKRQAARTDRGQMGSSTLSQNAENIRPMHFTEGDSLTH
jgi:hypothetical protein